MYALVCDSSSSCSSQIDVIVNASSKGMAWNMILSDVGREKLQKFTGQVASYYIFEIDGLTLHPETHSVVACDPEHIEFKFPEGDVKTHFEEFCKTTFGEVRYKMTNDEFADNYDKMVEMFIDTNCADDPFKAWDLHLLLFKHYDSTDKYVVLESTTHYYKDATVFSTPTEYKKHDCDDYINADYDGTELCSTTNPKYYSYLSSDIAVLY